MMLDTGVRSSTAHRGMARHTETSHGQKPVYSGNLAPVNGLRHTQSHLALSKATWWRLKLIMSADRMEARCLEFEMVHLI